MREPYREDLSQLRATLEEMKDLLKRIQKEDRPYFYRFLDRMKNTIEIGPVSYTHLDVYKRQD